MLFLIEYDRSRGTVVNMTTFPDHDRRVAADTRLDLEIALNRQGVQREVVLLEAANEDALRRTHRRYFANLPDLVENPGDRPT
jgi:hypothetical protein